MWKNCPTDKIYILDGGLATELERDGYSFLHDPLWSAGMLHTNPEAIVHVHDKYLKNGAEIITSASYQASIPGFQKHLRLKNKENKEIFVAGSVGSYGAALADGSEYTGDYCDKITHEELINWHRPRIECLIEAGVDLLAMETIPSVKEGEALMKLLKDIPNIEAWLSFSCGSMHQTSHREDIKSVLNCMKIAPSSQLVAIGVNCCPSEFAESLLKDISAIANGFPLIVYPNSGESWDTNKG
ncbi:selenocysteine Se-methyltransferase [Caerostris extrusa]|uniref:Selenocysteine Se-methyltransferase n=1 Tax=Caerostris extrusa TaxID=172846 RepID=A0AAV4QB92_CAEEX|nr:selenocysteine Se-methyltransferase [Caerostris extrusa]